MGDGAAIGRHSEDRRPHHRRRPAFRRRGDRAGLGLGLPAVRLRRAGRRAAVQREHATRLTIRPAGRPAAQVIRWPRRRSHAHQPRRPVASGAAPDDRLPPPLDQPVLEVTGSIGAAHGATLERQVAVVNPTIFFAQSLKDALDRRAASRSPARRSISTTSPPELSVDRRTAHDRHDRSRPRCARSRPS